VNAQVAEAQVTSRPVDASWFVSSELTVNHVRALNFGDGDHVREILANISPGICKSSSSIDVARYRGSDAGAGLVGLF
jgi:hypothetical protein